MFLLQKYQTPMSNMLTGVKHLDDNGHQCPKKTTILLD